jgi:hypothetical protein
MAETLIATGCVKPRPTRNICCCDAANRCGCTKNRDPYAIRGDAVSRVWVVAFPARWTSIIEG